MNPDPGLARTLDERLAPGVVRAEAEGRSVEVEVTDVDRLGVAVRGIKVRGAGGEVTEQAERLPEALGALPEDVHPVEVDPGLGGAVLRSVPHKREFFEVRTDGREVTVERLRAGPEGRAKVPFTLTREQLGRLVEDVAEVVTRVG